MRSARIAEFGLCVLLTGMASACGDDGNEDEPTSRESSTGGDTGAAAPSGGTGAIGTGSAGATAEPTGGSSGGDTGGLDTSSGGAATGGTTTGGVSSGGGATGGAATGGTTTGGASTGGTEPSTGGTEPSTGGAGGTDTTSACSTTAPVGLEVGNLIPDIELQRCDGTPVNLRELVCGNVITHVYSYASWCPGCRGFSGLEDMGFDGNSMYDSYHDDGYEQVIILSANADFTNPTEEDCDTLQALHNGLVVFDATGSKTTDVLGLKINGGTGLVDEQGLWVVVPPTDDPEDGGMSAVFTELMSRFGFTR